MKISKNDVRLASIVIWKDIANVISWVYRWGVIILWLALLFGLPSVLDGESPYLLPQPRWYASVCFIYVLVVGIIILPATLDDVHWKKYADLPLSMRLAWVTIWSYWLGATAKSWLYAPNWVQYAILAIPLYVVACHIIVAYVGHVKKGMKKLKK